MKFIHDCTLFIAKDDNAVDKEFNPIYIPKCLCEEVAKRRSTDNMVANTTVLKVYIPFSVLFDCKITPIKKGQLDSNLKTGYLVKKGTLGITTEENNTLNQPILIESGARIITSISVYDFGSNAHIVIVCE